MYTLTKENIEKGKELIEKANEDDFCQIVYNQDGVIILSDEDNIQVSFQSNFHWTDTVHIYKKGGTSRRQEDKISWSSGGTVESDPLSLALVQSKMFKIAAEKLKERKSLEENDK